MRARNIKPSLFDNEVLGTADPLITILFAGLWCIADREGRLEDRSVRIRAKVFPYRTGADVEAMLTFLHQNGFIVRYSIGDQKLIQISKWHKHQAPHHKEAASSLPPPTSSHAQSKLDPSMSHASGNDGVKNDVNPPDSLIPDSLIPDSCASTKNEQSKSQKLDVDPLKANSAARRVVEIYNREVAPGTRIVEAARSLVANLLVEDSRATEQTLTDAVRCYAAEAVTNEPKHRASAKTFFAERWVDFLDRQPPPTVAEREAESHARREQQRQNLETRQKHRAKDLSKLEVSSNGK